MCKSLFSPKVIRVPAAPRRDEQAIKAAGDRARAEELKARKGRKSTILTGRTGITGDDAVGQRKALLGE